MKNNTWIIYFLFPLLIVFFSPAYATPIESVQHLQTIAQQFLNDHIQTAPQDQHVYKINPTKIAFEVPVCDTQIVAAIAENNNINNVHALTLSCVGTHPWKIDMPVSVSILSRIVVAAKTLEARLNLAENDLDYAMYDKNNLYQGYYTDKQEVIGRETSYAIPAGKVLTKLNTHAPIIIHNNQVVSLIFQTGSISVQMKGVAKSDGALNGMIKVYNPISKKIIDSIVTGANQAMVLR